SDLWASLEEGLAGTPDVAPAGGSARAAPRRPQKSMRPTEKTCEQRAIRHDVSTHLPPSTVSFLGIGILAAREPAGKFFAASTVQPGSITTGTRRERINRQRQVIIAL